MFAVNKQFYHPDIASAIVVDRAVQYFFFLNLEYAWKCCKLSSLPYEYGVICIVFLELFSALKGTCYVSVFPLRHELSPEIGAGAMFS